MSDCGGSVSDCSSSSDVGMSTTVALSESSSSNGVVIQRGNGRLSTKNNIVNRFVVPESMEDWHIIFDDAAYDEKKKSEVRRMTSEETMDSYVADYIKGMIGVLALSVFGGFLAPVAQ